MRLLFDHNLSPRLVTLLVDLFPGSAHVYEIGLETSSDAAIWEYALQNDFVLVTKDADFGDLSILRGFPPKVIWIRRGNCSTQDVEALLRSRIEAVRQLEIDPTLALIPLF